MTTDGFIKLLKIKTEQNENNNKENIPYKLMKKVKINKEKRS